MTSHQEIREATQGIQQRFADFADRADAQGGQTAFFSVQEDLGSFVARMMSDINILAASVEQLVDDVAAL